jgi:hypothetical protein
VAHWDFRLTLIKDLIQEAGRFPRIQTAFRLRPTPSTEKLIRLDFLQNTHWARATNRFRCCVSAANKQEMKVKCEICNVGLCWEPCFKIYHTKLHF